MLIVCFQDKLPTPETGKPVIRVTAGEKARMFGRAVREGTLHELQFDKTKVATGSANDEPRENDDEQGERREERERGNGQVGDRAGERTGGGVETS